MPAPVPSRHSKDDTPVSALSRAQLLDVLSDLVRDLERLDLALSADGIEAARTLRDGPPLEPRSWWPILRIWTRCPSTL